MSFDCRLENKSFHRTHTHTVLVLLAKHETVKESYTQPVLVVGPEWVHFKLILTRQLSNLGSHSACWVLMNKKTGKICVPEMMLLECWLISLYIYESKKDQAGTLKKQIVTFLRPVKSRGWFSNMEFRVDDMKAQPRSVRNWHFRLLLLRTGRKHLII